MCLLLVYGAQEIERVAGGNEQSGIGMKRRHDGGHVPYDLVDCG